MRKDLIALFIRDDRLVSTCTKAELAGKIADFKRWYGGEITTRPITEVVKAPDSDPEAQINELVTAMKRGYEVYTQNGLVAVEINRGDWKHDHWFLDGMVTDIFECRRFSEVTTEESGDDAYSSIHYFKVS